MEKANYQYATFFNNFIIHSLCLHIVIIQAAESEVELAEIMATLTELNAQLEELNKNFSAANEELTSLRSEGKRRIERAKPHAMRYNIFPFYLYIIIS